MPMSNETEILPNLMREDPFEVVMRGYNRRQVDDYVTRSRNQIRDLEERLARALDEVEQARREIAEVRSQGAPARPQHEEVSERMAQILALAEEEAAQKRTAADEEIVRARTEAEDEAKRLVQEATDEADNIRSSAQAQAEQTVSAANTEADRLISGSKEQSERTLEEARAQAENLLSDAERRAATINDGASRRLEGLTATHTEAIRRLTEVHDVLGNLLRSDSAAEPFEQIGGPTTATTVDEQAPGATPAEEPVASAATTEAEDEFAALEEEPAPAHGPFATGGAVDGTAEDETDDINETRQIPIVTDEAAAATESDDAGDPADGERTQVKPADDEDFEESVRIIHN